MPVVEFAAQPGMRGNTLFGELKSIEPVIGRIAIPDDQSLLFHLGDQSADSAFLQAQPGGEVLLRHAGFFVELMQGMGGRRRNGLVSMQPTGELNEIDHQGVQFRWTRNNRAPQLCRTTLLGNVSCSIQL